MKNINKGLGYLAVAAISIVAIIVTKSSDNALLISIVGFFLVGYMPNKDN